jgi:hypothetical protein
MAPSINYGQANQAGLADYFIERYNLVGRDAEYQKNRPTLRAIPRDTVKLAQGNFFDETLRIANGFSGSPGWAEGNKYYNPSKTVKWRVGDPYPQYGRLTFDTLALARNNLGTLIDLKGSEADGVRDEMLNTAEFELWNDGTGSRGKISVLGGSAATRVVTLTNIADVYNFPYGATVYGSTTSTGAGTDHGDLYKVTDLNPMAGQVTLTRVSGVAGDLAANDFLFVMGSKDAYMPGIPSFIPSADPADTLFGVTRTGNPALSGWRFTFKSSISETIQRAFATMGRWVNRAADSFAVCLSTTDWLLLSMEREGRVSRTRARCRSGVLRDSRSARPSAASRALPSRRWRTVADTSSTSPRGSSTR